MSKRIHQPRTSDEEVGRRKQWVDLDDGGVWVWEMTVRENMAVIQHAQRPSIDRRGGLDRSEQMLWQILMSCYDSDLPGAKLVFSHTDPTPVYRLRVKEYAKIVAAIGAVNGADEADLKELEAFIEARPGA